MRLDMIIYMNALLLHVKINFSKNVFTACNVTDGLLFYMCELNGRKLTSVFHLVDDNMMNFEFKNFSCFLFLLLN